MIFQNILQTIGNTPIVRLNRLFPNDREVYIKVEKTNPAGSIKDRIGLAMIEDAEKEGILKPDSVIVEPTSGNTGIGLAMAAAVKGYKIIIVMPESMSIERRKLMSAYGAKIELTPRIGGMKAAIEKAQELVRELPHAWMPSQFDNPSNYKAHMKTTAQEIIKDFPNGLDYLFTGVGTGGHLTGCAIALKKTFPKLKVFAIEPDQSPVISGGKPAPHALQGIGAGFIPKNLHVELLNGVIPVTKEEAYDFTRRVAREEGILVGISTGASLAAIDKRISELPVGSKVLTFAYDTGERYLSVVDLF